MCMSVVCHICMMYVYITIIYIDMWVYVYLIWVNHGVMCFAWLYLTTPFLRERGVEVAGHPLQVGSEASNRKSLMIPLIDSTTSMVIIRNINMYGKHKFNVQIKTTMHGFSM